MKWLPTKCLWSPFNLVVDPTNKCNFECVTCYAQYVKKKMKKETIEWSYLDYLTATSRYSPRSMNFGVTGEPMLAKHLGSMLRNAKSRGIKTIVSTNGSMLGSCDYLDDIDVLKVSLDSHKLNTYEKIRRNKSLLKILASIEKIVKLGKPVVRFEFVLLGLNYDEMSSFIEFAKLKGVESVFFRHFQKMGLPKDTVDMLVDVHDLPKHIRQAHELSKAIRVKTNLGDWMRNLDFIQSVYSSEELNDDRRNHVCLLPWTQMVVFANGDVGPCCNLSEMGDVYVGNIFKDKNPWNSSNMRKLRETFRDKKNYDLYPPCATCEYLGFKRLLSWTRLMPGWLL